MAQTYRYREIPDWQRLRERYCAFWDKRIIDGRFIAHIQNPNPDRPEPEPWMLEASEGKYLNPERFYKLSCWRRTAWNWHTDLFQYKVPSYGPNVLAGFCGARPVFGRDSVWHEPVISSLDEAEKITFDENNPYWKAHLETVEFFSEVCAGREQLGVTDFGGPTDWISTCMGTENFLVEALERPDKMREFALRLADDCTKASDKIFPIVTSKNDGMVNWMPVWSERKLGTVQDDMAINFSPEMYEDIFIPAIRKMAAHTEHTVLHWHDGCGHHLEAVLKIDEIDVVQYGHDPNTGPYRSKIEDMQAIQAAGKILFIGCVEVLDVDFFAENLDHKGLLMIINARNDEESGKMEEKINGMESES